MVAKKRTDSFVENNPGVDWALVAGFFFWVFVIMAFFTVIPWGQTRLPRPVLEIHEASASRNTLLIAHREGDVLRYANTKCVWIPDMTRPDTFEPCGMLVLDGQERPQGIVSIFEPTEVARLEKRISLVEGNTSKLKILDRVSNQQIFSQTITIAR